MNAATVFSTPDLCFAREPLAALLDSGLEALLRAHWNEVAHDKQAIALDPDWDRYAALETGGGFIAFGLRRDGDLIGYSAFFVNRSLHYRAHIFALNDVVYLMPKDRGIDGLVMILEAERQLRAKAITKVFYHAKTDAFLGDTDDSLGSIERMLELQEEYGVVMPDDMPLEGSTLGEVLAALGYTHVENTFGKLLKG